MILALLLCCYNLTLTPSFNHDFQPKEQTSLLSLQKTSPEYYSLENYEQSLIDQDGYPWTLNTPHQEHHCIDISNQKTTKIFYYEDPYDLPLPRQKDLTECKKLICCSIIGVTVLIILGFLILKN